MLGHECASHAEIDDSVFGHDVVVCGIRESVADIPQAGASLPFRRRVPCQTGVRSVGRSVGRLPPLTTLTPPTFSRKSSKRARSHVPFASSRTLPGNENAAPPSIPCEDCWPI